MRDFECGAGGGEMVMAGCWARCRAAVLLAGMVLVAGCAAEGGSGSADAAEFEALMRESVAADVTSASADGSPTTLAVVAAGDVGLPWTMEPAADAAEVATVPAVDDAGVTLRELLGVIEVAAEAEHGSYERDGWMADWGRGEHDDGLNTRHEVLEAQSLCETARTATAVVEGCWFSVYDDAWTEVPREFDVDHVVPLAEAHYSGGWAWSPAEREMFANAVVNLVAVSASANREKGADDPSEWMPASSGSHCAYLFHWAAVKAGWALTMDEAEHAAFVERLDECGDAATGLFVLLEEAAG